MVTYASTDSSDEEVCQQPTRDLPKVRKTVYRSDAIPSTPPDFAELFPSTRRLLIHHDDSTADGNMNLRVDAEVSTTTKGRRVKMTLFHLRMNNLRERQFSLRRYCRDSGREVCRSAKKYEKPSPANQSRRPSLQRSLSTALHVIGKKHLPALRHYDSGYESDDDDFEEQLRQFTRLSEVKATIPTDTVRLEFSNYAQVEVHRTCASSEKAYIFEYWGTPYQWECPTAPHAPYYLVNLATGKPMARIVPEAVSRRHHLENELEGCWVPPCSLEITDASVAVDNKADLADVIVATGLIALVDDSMKFRQQRPKITHAHRAHTSYDLGGHAHGHTRTTG